MNDLSKLINTSEPTMSSRELLELVNTARQTFGETQVRLNDFNNRVMDELDGEHYEIFVVTNTNGTQSNEIKLTVKQCLYVAMRESKAVRRVVTERLEALSSKSPTLPDNPFLLIAHFAQQAYEMQTQVSAIDTRLQVVEAHQQQLDQDNDHFTIKGFCSLHGIDLSNGKMSALSRKAKKLSEAKDYAHHEISDPRFGKVKTYHVDILTELFQMQNLI